MREDVMDVTSFLFGRGLAQTWINGTTDSLCLYLLNPREPKVAHFYYILHPNTLNKKYFNSAKK